MHGVEKLEIRELMAGYFVDSLDPLPWFNIDEISVGFSEEVSVLVDSLELSGVTVPRYGVSEFSYADRIATWVLDREIGDPDKLLIDLGMVHGMTGEALDGEWSGTYPSGDGTPGGDFHFRFNVLPGDVRQTGLVTSADWSAVRARVFQMPGTPEYSAFLDVDGSGLITSANWSRVRGRVFDQLPDGEPVPAEHVASTAGVSPPRVIGVWVSSTSWSQAFLEYLAETSRVLVAVPDEFVTHWGTSVTGNVLSNDFGLGSLSVSGVLDWPDHGVLDIDPNGEFVYTPEDYVGLDSFTYEVTDGVAFSSAEVKIQVENFFTVEITRISDYSMYDYYFHQMVKQAEARRREERNG